MRYCENSRFQPTRSQTDRRFALPAVTAQDNDFRAQTKYYRKIDLDTGKLGAAQWHVAICDSRNSSLLSTHVHLGHRRELVVLNPDYHSKGGPGTAAAFSEVCMVRH